MFSHNCLMAHHVAIKRDKHSRRDPNEILLRPEVLTVSCAPRAESAIYDYLVYDTMFVVRSKTDVKVGLIYTSCTA